MVEPLDPHEFHEFREIVAVMTGDDQSDTAKMIDKVGKLLGGDLAAAIARLA